MQEGVTVHGDYIEVTGPSPETDIVATLVRLLDPIDALRGVCSVPVLALARDIDMSSTSAMTGSFDSPSLSWVPTPAGARRVPGGYTTLSLGEPG